MYVEKYLLLFIRVYLGAFNLASGLNYFVRVWPQPVPMDALGASYMTVTLHMGLFQFAKVIEALAGLCLVANVCVPLALIVLFPVTVNVFVMNAFFSPLAHVVVSGTRNFLFHVVLLAAYARYYFPMLKPVALPLPLWRKGSARALEER